MPGMDGRYMLRPSGLTAATPISRAMKEGLAIGGSAGAARLPRWSRGCASTIRPSHPPDAQRQGEADGAAALGVAPGPHEVAPERLDGRPAQGLLGAPHGRPG